MNLAILHADVQRFITDHLQADTARIRLGKSPFSNINTHELVQQIESKKRCEKKLPLWYTTPGIYYPPKLSIEQASSEATAKYKAQLIKGTQVLDLTGGFGVDSYYFSLIAQKVVHCEIDDQLSAIVQHNHQVLGVKQISYYTGSGLNYLQSTDKSFDTIYIDPSRRINTRKVFKIADCEPNIMAHFELLSEKSNRILIKTSPLLDIQSGLMELKNVSEIHVVSVKNDCKELLWVIDTNFTGNEPLIRCAAINDQEIVKTFDFSLSEERMLTNIPLSDPLNFIYEPDVSLLKASCFKLITKKFLVLKLHQHTHLYTSKTLNAHFIGRVFRLNDYWDYKVFIKQKPIKQANIISRNFPLSAEELKKKHQLKDGGDDYLLFTKDCHNKFIVLNCKRI